MDEAALLETFRAAADAVSVALSELGDWGPSGKRAGQYRSDVVADEAALAVLRREGLSVLSEESDLTGERDAAVLCVLDPVDGSTNAARGISWFATSICAVDGEGPVVALVKNQATGRCYTAVRRGGAFVDGEAVAPRPTRELGHAVVGLAGYPPRYLGWRQYRALGAAALDLCAVADGTLDAYADCSRVGHGAWDYLGGLLVCEEAGALVSDGEGKELLVLDHTTRRQPIAAATPELHGELVRAWRQAFLGGEAVADN